jgi:hypothetical protein
MSAETAGARHHGTACSELEGGTTTGSAAGLRLDKSGVNPP